MNKLKRFFRITALAALALPLLFFTACPTEYRNRYYAADVTTPLLAAITEAWNTLSATRLSADGANVYTVYYWVTPSAGAALAALLPGAMDAADNRDMSPGDRYAISRELQDAVADFNSGRQRGTRAVTMSALAELIEEAQRLNDVNFARRIPNGYHLFYFQAWITPADHAATGINAQIASAVAMGGTATPAQIETQMLSLLESMTEMRSRLQRGGTFPPDETNISSEFSAIRIASNDGISAEGETDATRAVNALTPVLRRWQSPSYEPILEVEFAFPVSIGSIMFTPFAAADLGASPITEYQIDFWNPAIGGWDKVQGMYPVHEGGIIGHDGTAAITVRHFVQFDEELVSTRFRFNVTGGTGPVGLWEFRLLRGTEGRFALNDALGNAVDNIVGTRISHIDGVNIPPGQDWVTQDIADVYQAVIATATAVAVDRRSTRFAIREVHATLDAATGAFDGAKRDGVASGAYLEALTELDAALNQAWLFSQRFRMAATAAYAQAEAANTYTIHYVAPFPAQQRWNAFLARMETEVLFMETVAELNAGTAEVASERDILSNASFRGQRPTAPFVRGTNIAPYFISATQNHYWEGYVDAGQTNDGNFSRSLRNTTFNVRWGTLRGNGQPWNHEDCECRTSHPEWFETRYDDDGVAYEYINNVFCVGTGWITNTWGDARPNDQNPRRPPEIPIDQMIPVTANVNFGIPVPIEEIAIWFFTCGNATARGRVGDYHIEFFCLDDFEWKTAWRRSNSTYPVWGGLHYGPTQFRSGTIPSVAGTQPRTPHRFDTAVAPLSGPAGSPGANADIYVIGRPVIVSNQFRFTFHHSPIEVPIWMWGPRFFQFEFIHGPVTP